MSSANTNEPTFVNPLRNRIALRVLAIGGLLSCAGLLFADWFFYDHHFILSAAAQKAEYVILAFLVLLLLSTNFVTLTPKRWLDERQISQRNRATQLTYKSLVWGIFISFVAGYLYLSFPEYDVTTPQWDFSTRGLLWPLRELIMQCVLFGLTLPVAFLAWAEAKLSRAGK